MQKQIIRRTVSQSCLDYLSDTDLHPVVQRVLAARNVGNIEQLELSLNKLISHTQLSCIDSAVELLVEAVCEQRSILIVGDFDADGATSIAVAIRALRMMGLEKVDYLVPNRFEFGYGLTPEIVELAKRYKPWLLVTVDNGIASIEGVLRAKAYGMHVLITDHHLPGKQLPQADAIVNPNQHGDEFPSKALAGVGTLFYVMLALRAALRMRGWFAQQQLTEPNLASLLDLVALGTVADVVPLDFNNRILVAQGLARMRAGECCAGIKSLVEVSKRDAQRLSAQDLAFALGPRLNAAGRLDDMSIGVECLLSNDMNAARELAAQLHALNDERREIEKSMHADAIVIIEKLHLGEQGIPDAFCLYDATWHQGVVGILASRIKESFHRPAIAFAVAHEDAQTGHTVIKGSARSIKGLHMRDVLDAVATRYPGLIVKFGGHAMAAGLSILEKDFADFQRAFVEEVALHVDDEILQQRIYSDGQLQQHELDMQLAKAIAAAGPWGQSFPEPLFDGVFEIVKRRTVGGCHLKLWLRHPQATTTVDAIAFNTLDNEWPQSVSAVHIVYKLDVNCYMGFESLQLVIEQLTPLEVSKDRPTALAMEEATP